MAVVDSYTVNDDSDAQVRSANDWAQSFTASKNYDLSYVKLLLGASGNPSAHTVTVEIFATSSDKPTGPALATGTISGATIYAGGLGWYQINMDSPVSLSNGVVYAIWVSNDTAGSTSQHIDWRMDVSSPAYGGGQLYYSGNGGSTWTGYGYDSMFETHESDVTYSELSGTVAAVSEVEAADLELNQYVTLSGTVAAVSAVEPASLGQVAVSLAESVVYTRLMAVGNDRFYYEAI